MQKTIVEVTCTSKSSTETNYNKGKKEHVMKMEVGYDPNNVFYQQSGGTFMELHTVNEAAANIFEVGEKYQIEISKAAGPEPAE